MSPSPLHRHLQTNDLLRCRASLAKQSVEKPLEMAVRYEKPYPWKAQRSKRDMSPSSVSVHHSPKTFKIVNTVVLLAARFILSLSQFNDMKKLSTHHIDHTD